MENETIYTVEHPAPKKGFAIAALVLGIASVALGYEAWYLGVTAGVVGLVLSVMAKKSYEEIGEKNGMATAGFILSIVGIALSCLGLVMCIACVGCSTVAGAGALTGGLAEGDLPSDLAQDIADSLNSAMGDIASGLGEAASELAQAATEIAGVI